MGKGAAFDVDKVLDQLTTTEKIGLTAGIDFWHTYPVERLGVPSIRTSDGPNGVRGTKFFNGVPSAVFPNGTGLASTFDKDLFREAGQLMAEEAKHKGAHVILGPTTNMQRGPNGGRGFESFSEDPYLAGIASAGVVGGIQDGHIAATIKHYVGNDLEHERNSSDSIITQRALREIYLEPFRLAVKYSQPKAFMTGYNKINGEHVSQSKFLIDDVLRKEWGWEGLVMSDWYGTYTSKDSLNNGLDLEMPGPARLRTSDAVGQQITSKEVHINALNDRVRNVLELVKYALDGEAAEFTGEDTKNNTEKTAELLRKIAADAIVLLKNEDDILPLKKEEKIAVFGPNAKYGAYAGGGSASLRPYYIVTPYEGVTKKLGYEPPFTVGAYAHDNLPGLAQQTINPDTGKPGLKMSFYHQPRGTEGREKFDELEIETSYHILFDYKNEKIRNNLFYADFEGEFTADDTAEYEFGVTVLGTAQIFIDDKLIVDNKDKQIQGRAFFNTGTVEVTGKVQLEKGKKYNVRVEFGSGSTRTYEQKSGVDFVGNGAIQFGVAKVIDAQEEIKKAASIAKAADKAVIFIGLNGEWESEGYDRPDLALPGHTNDLVEAIIAANPNTIVVNQSGTPVEFPWLQKVKGLIHAWFGGNELGNGIADVLFGDVNPSGKLSLSFPLKFEDNPAFLNFHTERGRVLYGEDIFVGYRFYEKLQRKVAFPFGYGLSYTSFEFSNLKSSVDESNDKLKFSVDVKNTGKLKGKEVVQFYIKKVESDVIRPIKELKGFEKIELEAGKQSTVSTEISLKDSISFFDEYQNKWSAQAGEYEVHVGSSSDDIELIEKFNVEKSHFWTGI
ncbi:beta-glucosidase [Wickerhamomyces ciferrii]|uniref:beta-glucosidase n=1 Tax=Wickerhamomyces ciferrii (strain ATCC 14091 / BCRC 22168 / CBS 111 / JCM 3599 / NBRC 0793 / NRRL Y-1031 F-60-10) TaxID=1206466 RepID=K0KKQ5_WICCF|nr:beta-glucosidase [Wickerhamomyces ciferrii]CCH42049.1 beta-glucosidase [Wickerhamomyces ciferrii]